MARLVLVRSTFAPDTPTLGSFLWENPVGVTRHLFIRSIELPWRDNASRVSCIPKGEYRMRWSWSPAFKRMLWEVMHVQDRYGIRIHAANYTRQLRGCIAPVMEWKDLDGDGIIDGISSGEALGLLEAVLRPYEGAGLELRLM